MLAAENKTRYTAEDYMLLEEGAPFQLINYDLVMSPSPNSFHQRISFELTIQIGNFLKTTKNKGFAVAAPMDVKLDDGNIYQPDFLFVSADRVAKIVKNIIYGAPDLVIEILSPSNGYYDLRQKKDIYEKFGVKEYIIIDPIQQSAEVYVLKDDAFFIDQKIQSPGRFHSHVLEGFSVSLKELFSI